MFCKRLLIVAIAGGALSACNTMYTHIGDDAYGMGEAAKYDAAVQIINPTPVYSAENAQPGDSGDLGAHAVKRYRSGQVKEVQTMQTSSSTSGGGGGGPQ